MAVQVVRLAAQNYDTNRPGFGYGFCLALGLAIWPMCALKRVVEIVPHIEQVSWDRNKHAMGFGPWKTVGNVVNGIKAMMRIKLNLSIVNFLRPSSFII